MFCKNCGSQLKDDSVFCGECGTKVAEGGEPLQANETTERQSHVYEDITQAGTEEEAVTEVSAAEQRESGIQPQSSFAPGEAHNAPPQTYYQQPYGQPEPPKKNGISVAAVVIGVVLLGAVLGFGGYTVYNNNKEKERLQQEQIAKAQREAQQAHKEAEEAQQAQKEAQQAQKEAEEKAQQAQQAQADAERDKASAEQRADAVLAALSAARSGRTIDFDGYIFPSDRQYITYADMMYWDRTITQLARNEIYARHGYVFQTDYIQKYFASQSWYVPNPSFDGNGLSSIEKANVNTILNYEKSKGWQ